MVDNIIVPGSFRDPSGHIFKRNNKIYRQVNTCYQQYYDQFIRSGLYESLVNKAFLIEHHEIDSSEVCDKNAYKTIEPDLIPFISYPYEWSFSQLKDAALLTLDIQLEAMKHDMSLKDATAYNVQFLNCKPIFIDTLSFEPYNEGAPWVAYKQFCQHFLAPLSLMTHVDIRMSQLLRVFIDGVPIDFASNALPLRTKLSPSLLAHIHLHANSQNKHADDKNKGASKTTIKKSNLLALIHNLKNSIAKLHWAPSNTEWGEYYESTNYSDSSNEKKKIIVRNLIKSIMPKITWDIGANTGIFTQEAINNSQHVISWDIDDAAIEKHYLHLKSINNNLSILPLRLDLTNPSPGIGWAGTERDSLEKRGKADVVLALALIHHLAISNNVPLDKVADFFSKICHNLVLEFVPKSDSQVKRLLATREDIFNKYTQKDMELEFKHYFTLIDCMAIDGSERSIYHFQNKA